MQESCELRKIKDVQERDCLEGHATRELSALPEESNVLS